MIKRIQDQIDALVEDLKTALTEDFEVSQLTKQEILVEVKRQVNEITVDDIMMED